MKKMQCPKCNKEEITPKQYESEDYQGCFENEINCPRCGVYEFNTCDKCNKIQPTDELIWLDADNFEAFKGDTKRAGLYKNYDALCEPCYQSETLTTK